MLRVGENVRELVDKMLQSYAVEGAWSKGSESQSTLIDIPGQSTSTAGPDEVGSHNRARRRRAPWETTGELPRRQVGPHSVHIAQIHLVASARQAWEGSVSQ
jgi:hypothetical protein